MSLKLIIEIWTPWVDEKPRLAVCPEQWIAKGVRVKPSSRTCGTPTSLVSHHQDEWDNISLTIKPRSSAVPGRTEQVAICVLELSQWEMSTSN